MCWRKNISVKIKQIENNLSQELIGFNPYGTVSTLVDRELVLYRQRTVMEYLDERFPHLPLKPAYRDSLWFKVASEWINREWLLPPAISKSHNSQKLDIHLSNCVRHWGLSRQCLINIDDEFTLVDCYLALFLWRLPKLALVEWDDVDFKKLKDYMTRIFKRDAFLASLTEAEREIQHRVNYDGYVSNISKSLLLIACIL